MISGRIAEHYLVTAGHTTGPFQPQVILKAFQLLAEDVLHDVNEVASRYKPVYPLGVDPMTDPTHMAKVAAENCARAILARLSVEVAR